MLFNVLMGLALDLQDFVKIACRGRRQSRRTQALARAFTSSVSLLAGHSLELNSKE